MTTSNDVTGANSTPCGPSRRDLIRASAGALAGLAVGGGAWAQPPSAPAVPAGKARSLRLAHLSDVHIQPELGAGEGLAACLKHVQSLNDRPELILTGGDSVMDSLATDEARTKLQWELWQKVWKSECSLPVRSALGNHDCWGWNKKDSKTKGDEPNYGKNKACEVFGRERPYVSWDQGGWHLVILDSITDRGNNDGAYLGKLDDPQFAWLEHDLKSTPATTPVLVLSHIPIMAACVWDSGGKVNKDNNWEMNGAKMHVDQGKIRELFRKHPNVKVCISGHIHLVDRVEYNGVTYLCNGAVSGNWWKGTHKQCKPGYGVLDLFTDGSFANQYVEYGWSART